MFKKNNFLTIGQLTSSSREDKFYSNLLFCKCRASERSPFEGSCCGGGYTAVDSMPPSPSDSEEEPPPPPRYRVVMLGKRIHLFLNILIKH